jgi:hypothetical protein
MQISNIDVSLSLGQLLWKKQKKALWLFMIAPSLLPLFTIVFAVVLLINKIQWDGIIIFVMVSFNLIFLLLLILPIYIIIKDRKNKNKIKLWLDDAIETKAYSKKTGELKLLFLPKGIVIQVTFKINNKNYIKDSTVKVFGGGKAYLASFKKYADREISILYSPKYDEVLILKS